MRAFALALIALASCNDAPKSGVRLTLHFASSVTSAELKTVTTFEFHGFGAVEDFTGTRPAATGDQVGAARTSVITYLPNPSSTSLTIEVTAVDASGDVVASGSTGVIAVSPSHGTTATVTLSPVKALADGGADASVDGFDIGVDAVDLYTGDAALPACTIYVANQGLTGHSPLYTTITDAINAASDGDVICVAAQNHYNEVVTVNKGVTVRALDPTQHPVVDGMYTMPGGAADNYPPDMGQMICYEPSEDPNANQGPSPKQACWTYSALVNFSVSNVSWIAIDVTNSRGRGINSGADDQPTLSNNTVFDSEISNTRIEAVTFVEQSNLVVAGNTIHDYGTYAVYDRGWYSSGLYGAIGVFVDQSDTVAVSNNAIYHGYGTGITLATFRNTNHVTIAHNTIADVVLPSISVTNSENTTIDSNLVYRTSDTTWFAGTVSASISIAGSLQATALSNIVISNNVVYGGTHLIELTQSGSTLNATNISIYTNTLLAPASGTNDGALHNDMTTLSGLSVVDNLVANTSEITDTFNIPTGSIVTNNLWPSGATVPSGLSSSSDQVGASGLVNETYAPPALPTAFDTSKIKLGSTSKAINKGTTIPPTTDFFGEKRPQGSAYDIGAAEFPN